MEAGSFALALWAAVVFWALGQIWFAQIVIYPLFADVGRAEYTDYHRSYARRIPAPVIVPGFATFLAPVPLAIFVSAVPLWMHWANVAAGLIGLVVTLLLEIPRHAKLANGGKDDRVIAELVRYNWLRTVSISAQAVIALMMLVVILAAR